MVVLFIGPSGCGKTTLAKELGYRSLVSTTTRPKRTAEIDGVHYNFVSEETFSRMQFIETTKFNGYRYGLTSDAVMAALQSDEIYTAALDAHGIAAIKQIAYPTFSNNVYVMCLTSSATRLVANMRLRGDSEENIIDRLIHMIDHRDVFVSSQVDQYCNADIPMDALVADAKDCITRFFANR